MLIIYNKFIVNSLKYIKMDTESRELIKEAVKTAKLTIVDKDSEVSDKNGEYTKRAPQRNKRPRIKKKVFGKKRKQ